MKYIFTIVILLNIPMLLFAKVSNKEGPVLCKSLNSIKSEPNPPTDVYSLSFAVETSIPTQISWINFEGQPETKTRPMNEGMRWVQTSYFDHWWLFTDKDKKCLAVYSAQKLSKIRKIDDKILGISRGKSKK